MRDLEIAQQHHLNFPTHYSGNFPELERLYIHHCSYFKIDLHGERWKNLKEIIITDSKYLELRIAIEAPLTRFHLQGTEFVHMKDFSGSLPHLKSIQFQNNKYLKISGPFKGELGIIEMNFLQCPYLELFKSAGIIPKLQKITFTDCSFATIDGKFNFPELELVEIHNSPYLKLKKPETDLIKLQKILISNSSYAQIPVSSRCPNLKVIDITHSKYVQVPKRLQNAMILKIDQTHLIDPEEIRNRLGSQESDEATTVLYKYCPYCGNKMEIHVNTCPTCHASFEE